MADNEKSDERSALDWHSPIYDNEQWDPPPPSQDSRAYLIELLITGLGAALFWMVTSARKALGLKGARHPWTGMEDFTTTDLPTGLASDAAPPVAQPAPVQETQ